VDRGDRQGLMNVMEWIGGDRQKIDECDAVDGGDRQGLMNVMEWIGRDRQKIDECDGVDRERSTKD